MPFHDRGRVWSTRNKGTPIPSFKPVIVLQLLGNVRCGQWCKYSDGTAVNVSLSVTLANLPGSRKDMHHLIALAHVWLALTSSWLFQLYCLVAILSIIWHHTLHFLLSNLLRGRKREREREIPQIDFKCGCVERIPINALKPAGSCWGERSNVYSLTWKLISSQLFQHDLMRVDMSATDVCHHSIQWSAMTGKDRKKTWAAAHK